MALAWDMNYFTGQLFSSNPSYLDYFFFIPGYLCHQQGAVSVRESHTVFDIYLWIVTLIISHSPRKLKLWSHTDDHRWRWFL